MSHSLLLYARTLRHLHWRQWLYRPLRQLQRALPTGDLPPGRLEARSWPAFAETIRRLGPREDDPLGRAREVLEHRFSFLNRTRQWQRPDWNANVESRLWRYHLHYFDYARSLAWAAHQAGDALYEERLRGLVASWIDDVPAGRGDAWDPYPVSMRCLNWLHALAVVDPRGSSRFAEVVAANVHRQLCYLERHIEWQLSGNHLLKNLQALAVGGLVLSSPRALAWRKRWLPHLWREYERQVLADGVHYERTPMYHAQVAGDLLELIALAGAVGEPVPASTKRTVAAMMKALACFCRADGSLHLWNDSVQGVAPGRAVLDRFAGHVLDVCPADPEGAWALKTAGYYGFCDPKLGDRLIVDCGAVGAADQPAHAHCDQLSFELDVGGAPVICDSGVAGYAEDPLREYWRSTRAHNTVSVAGREQSEMWGSFRVARRARARVLQFDRTADTMIFSGESRPYWDGRVRHVRTIERRPGTLRVCDVIEGAPGAPCSSFLHLHPDWRVERAGDSWVVRSPTQELPLKLDGVDRVHVHRGRQSPAQGWYAAEFGKAMPADVIELTVDRNEGRSFGMSIRLTGRRG